MELPKESSNQGNQSFQFMLEEYKRIQSLRLFYDQQGENRGKFYLTITSTSIGIIAILSQSSDISSENLLFFSEVLAIVLIFFGLNILNRLAARAVQLKAYQHLLQKIQEYFSIRDPEVSDYIKVQNKVLDRKKRLKVLGFVLEGTLSDLMRFVISLLIGGLIFERLFQMRIIVPIAVTLSVIGILASRVLLRIYYDFLKRNIEPEL